MYTLSKVQSVISYCYALSTILDLRMLIIDFQRAIVSGERKVSMSIGTAKNTSKEDKNGPTVDPLSFSS